MKVAFIARSTLHTVHGGDTVQIIETAKELKNLGVSVTIFLTNEKIDYTEFDLLHFFNITRPADILFHVKRSGKPFALSPILVDHSFYDKQQRTGISGFIFRKFSSTAIEYIKAVSRWVLAKDTLQTKSYLWKGHKKTCAEILTRTSMLLPNSASEYEDLNKMFSLKIPYEIVPCGIDPTLFKADNIFEKDATLIVCAARIEGRKNQLNVIKALNNSPFRLLLIGDPAPNQRKYFEECKKAAGRNVTFTGKISQAELAGYYQKAKVHVLASWFESCGLSSLEAAAMGCNVVITDKGYARDYFSDDAFYCEPGNVDSIQQAIYSAAKSDFQNSLQEKVLIKYTWKEAAIATLNAYKKINLS